jgi:GH35 family endo-1,4-beta-xylanase
MSATRASALLAAAAVVAAAAAAAPAAEPDPKFYVFLCLGQSNMEGFPGIEEQDRAGVERFKMLAAVDFARPERKRGEWYPAVPPLCRGSSGLSPADSFGRTLAARLPKDVTVGVVNVSVAGCKIELFDKATHPAYAKSAPGWMANIIKGYGGDPYARLVEMGKLAQKSGVIKGVLLHQGESNTGDRQWPAKVKAVYENLLRDLDLKAEAVPLLAGEVVHADQNGACAAMNAIIGELPKTVPTARVVSSAGCKARPDRLHFTPEGYRELGKRYAEAMLPLLADRPAPPNEAEKPGPTPTTYCNPIPLPNYPIGRKARDVTTGSPVPKDDWLWLVDRQRQFRELADVSVLWHEGAWYLYPSVDMAWVSRDGGATWRHHPLNVRDIGYAPTVVRHKGRFLLMASESAVYAADAPLGPFRELGRIKLPDGVPGQVDPMLFSDDGRLFLYWGCTPTDGIFGVELDADDPTKAVGKPVRVIAFEPDRQPWQRLGDWNEQPARGWVEGAWMLKRNGRYYLTYSAGGTENRTYAVGCAVGRSPLGPFVPQNNNPVLRTTTGLVTGTAHGCVVEGPHDSLWAFYTVRAGVVHGFERRLGMDPAYIGEDGELHVAPASSLPQRLPTAGKAAGPAGWLPLNAGPRTVGSTDAPNLSGRLAADDDLRTWWQPAADDRTPTLTSNLTAPGAVARAVRVIWRDVGLDTKAGANPGPFRYRVEVRTGSDTWATVIDRTGSTDDLLMDYRECPPTPGTAARLVVVGAPPGITPGVAEFTVFGEVREPAGRTVKDVYTGHFAIGTAGDIPGSYSTEELNLVREHFGVVTPENCMKPGPVHPAEDRWSFERPDALVKWCGENKLAVHGHTLVWHAQTGNWFFAGGDKEVITRRLKDHVTTLAGRYRGKVRGWDVVNEAINDGGTAETAKGENLRNCPWLRALGPDYIPLAFRFAHAADPDARLYYNDYNIEAGPKHDSSMALLRRLVKDGVPIHGVGIQGHWSTRSVPYEVIDKAIADYASLGLKVSITELDVTIRGAAGGQLGPGRPRGPVAPPSAEDLKAQADAYAKLFAIFLKHKDTVERVTFWGLSDRRTWRYGQHPLLFDAENRRKPAYAAVVDAVLRPDPDLGPPR